MVSLGILASTQQRQQPPLLLKNHQMGRETFPLRIVASTKSINSVPPDSESHLDVLDILMSSMPLMSLKGEMPAEEVETSPHHLV